MNKLDTVLDKTKLIIKNQVESNKIYNFGKPFDRVQKVYYATNENIAGYMSLFNMKNRDVLTVMASGDHPFNACFYGSNNIDTFDTNILTRYYAIGIKRSAILTFNYHEYLEFYKKVISCNISLEELNSLVSKLYSYMDTIDKIFWKNIVDYNNKLQKNNINPINLFRMLLINITSIDEEIKKNSYLFNENNYNILRNRLGRINLSFYNIDCLDLPNKLKKKYDLIFLSNIADYFYKNFNYYWKYDSLRRVTDSFEKILNDNGILFINYLYNFYSTISKKYHSTLANASSLKLSDLTYEQCITFDSLKYSHIKDGVLIKRK